MKFDTRFNEIINEWRDDDYDYDYDPHEFDDDDYGDPSEDFEYLWEDLQLDSENPNLYFTVYMTAYWKLYKGSCGSYWEPAEPDVYEFDEGKEIIAVEVYSEDGTTVDDDLNEKEFKEKYPNAYKTFMKDYFNEAPDTAPTGKSYPQSLAGKRDAVLGANY